MASANIWHTWAGGSVEQGVIEMLINFDMPPPKTTIYFELNIIIQLCPTITYKMLPKYFHLINMIMVLYRFEWIITSIVVTHKFTQYQKHEPVPSQ